MTTLFSHVSHPHLAKRTRPIATKDHLARGKGPIGRANAWLAVKVSAVVGTMACAYVFAGIAFISLPAALTTASLIIIVSWVAQTFLQLVLLSIIIVGQNITAAASDARAQSTYDDAEAVLHEALQIQAHLHVQDEILQKLIGDANR